MPKNLLSCDIDVVGKHFQNPWRHRRAVWQSQGVSGIVMVFLIIGWTALSIFVALRQLVSRAKDAQDFQKRSRSRFPAARASRYASHPTFLVANAFALRVFNASYTF